MREIDGLVCIAKTTTPIRQELLFGPDVIGQKSSYVRFAFNGLTPFKDKSSVELALEELKRNKEFTSVRLAKIKLAITESDNQIDQLKSLKVTESFVIVAELDDEFLLLGRQIKNIPGVCYAHVSELELNGLRGISECDDMTLWILDEVRRQGQVAAYLGTFLLDRI